MQVRVDLNHSSREDYFRKVLRSELAKWLLVQRWQSKHFR